MEKICKTTYNSPIGKLILAANSQGHVGCEFCKLAEEIVENDSGNIFLTEAKAWLDRYFANKKPSIKNLRLAMRGTPFQLDVWECLKTIQYGKTITYGDIAKRLALKYGKVKMSAQAVGQAVGSNPIGIIVPCHRVLGVDGKLVGYAGGADKKIALLTHEGLKIDKVKNKIIFD